MTRPPKHTFALASLVRQQGPAEQIRKQSSATGPNVDDQTYQAYSCIGFLQCDNKVQQNRSGLRLDTKTQNMPAVSAMYQAAEVVL